MTPAEALAQLRESYGYAPPVVLFIQRAEGGPVKIGRASNPARRLRELESASPDPVIVRALVPGGQALEHWFHRRHSERSRGGGWYSPAGPVVEDAIAVAVRHRIAYGHSPDVAGATVHAVRASDPHLADFERLYLSGTPVTEIAKLAGMPLGRARWTVDVMRAMGFDLSHRRVFAPRPGTPAPKGQIFDDERRYRRHHRRGRI
jgi:hypothetical protein